MRNTAVDVSRPEGLLSLSIFFVFSPSKLQNVGNWTAAGITTIVPGFAQSYRVPKLVFHVPVAVSIGLDGDAAEKLVEVATSILTA